MNAPLPTISAIVPVHNGAPYIADALASIREQEHPVTEIIVVDDGSTDNTISLVRAAALGAIIVEQSRTGPAAARNAGAKRATGDILAFLDHDDLWPSDRTDALVQALATAPEIGMVYGRVRILDMPGVSPGVVSARMNNKHNPVLFQAAMIRRAVWMAAGGMDTRLQSSEDLDLCLRLIDAGVRMATVDTTTVIYRRHFTNLTRDEALSSDAKLTVLRSAINRRRSTTE